MKPKRPAVILLFALVALVLIVAKLHSPQSEFHARGRLLIRPTMDDIPLNWGMARLVEISNTLSDSRRIETLAAASGVNPSGFKLTGVYPIRGTRIASVEYSAASSNLAQCVASNACEILVQFYQTNGASASVTNFGAESFEMPGLWEKSVRRIRSVLP